MWGRNIVGFGIHRSLQPNGRVAEWMLTAFAPRKQGITLYIMDGLDRHGALLATLGAHSTGKACLYIKRLADLRVPVLTKIVQASVRNRKATSLKKAAAKKTATKKAGAKKKPA